MDIKRGEKDYLIVGKGWRPWHFDPYNNTFGIWSYIGDNDNTHHVGVNHTGKCVAPGLTMRPKKVKK